MPNNRLLLFYLVLPLVEKGRESAGEFFRSKPYEVGAESLDYILFELDLRIDLFCLSPSVYRRGFCLFGAMCLKMP